MKTEIEKAIKILVDKAARSHEASYSLHLSQAALNLAQLFHVYSETSKTTNVE